jgi:hypothetical protein
MYSEAVSEMRTAKITVLLRPSTLERLDAYRAERRWTRSTAIAALVEEGLGRKPEDCGDGEEAP